MPDHDPKKTLSEISHLFLSSIREKQTNGSPRPLRTPPQASPASQAPPHPHGLPPREPGGPWSGMNFSDLTAEEMAHVAGPHASPANGAPGPARSASPGGAALRSVSAVIAAHLNGKQFDRVKDYARHLAGQVGGRIGLIELDASEFRLMCFEPGMPAGAEPDASDPRSAECYDPRQIAEAIEEMNWDVQRWLLLLPAPRVPEARALLRQVEHWVLLTTCDHDGVVCGYRTLKGLIDPSHHPRLTLALLDGNAESEMVSVHRKLAGVCQQFLGLRLDPEPPVRKSYRIGEHLVMYCRPTRDKGQMATQPQWGIVSEFLARAVGPGAGTGVDASDAAEGGELVEDVVIEDRSGTGAVESAVRDVVGDVVVVTAPQPAAPVETITVAPVPVTPAGSQGVGGGAGTAKPQAAGPAFDEVIDLADDSGTADAVLSAVLRQNNGTYVECPVRAPMCGGVRVAVGRDRGVVLFAVAREGLGELRNIGQAYRWLSDNRPLLSMALPQFAIDTNQPPRLRLLVDHSDLSADALQPVLQSGHVTVQSYRKLRWGGKTGLLLDAA